MHWPPPWYDVLVFAMSGAHDCAFGMNMRLAFPYTSMCFLKERNNLKLEFQNLKMRWQFARLAAILSMCGLVVSPLSYRSQSCSPLFYLKITSKLIIQLLRAFLGGKSCRWIAGCKRSWDILCRPLMKQWLGIIWPCNMENSKLLIARTYALNILQIGFSAYRASRP